MLFTSHLIHPDSLTECSFHQHIPYRTRLTKEANQQLQSTQPILPPANPWPYTQVGVALDYHIRSGFILTGNSGTLIASLHEEFVNSLPASCLHCPSAT
jgi:hypothetical protein